jgi:hypothetical protein
MVNDVQQRQSGGWEKLVAGTEAEHGDTRALGHQCQRLRAEFVDQPVRQDGIGSHQDDVGFGQALKERHVNAVFYGHAVGQ